MSPPTPRSLGYRMPAEWEHQQSTWLAWPTNRDTWSDDQIGRVRDAYVELIACLTESQEVCLLVDDARLADEVRQRIARSEALPERVRYFQIPTVDAWIRDYGPTFVLNDNTSRVGLVRWQFNAWGDKYADLKHDGRVPAEMKRELNLPVFDAGIVLEGGSIDVNGCGTLLTTEQCLLHPNRNPGLDRAGIENSLREFLNVSNIIWLGRGIEGDDTDGHIDDIARFVAPGKIVCAYEDNASDVNRETLRDNFSRLSSAKDQDGRPFEVVKLPMPDPVESEEGRLPASYTNFYVGNTIVAVPVFGQAKDAIALDIIRGCFPDRRVVGIDTRAMVHGLGTLHCCTQQQPGGRATGRRIARR